MRSQVLKDVFFGTVGRLSAVNLLRYRLNGRGSHLQSGPRLLLHLGSGTHRIDGFVNIDGNPLHRPDLWLDLRLGLPFPDASVEGAYSCHTLEHFVERDVRRILAETFRVLKPGCGIRIVTPDLGKAIDAYTRQDNLWFNDFPESRRSLGGRFNNYLLCGDQHKLMFDGSFMSEILSSLGFADIIEMSPHQSKIFAQAQLATFEYESPKEHRSLFIEALKPAS